jgi:hypothetical protein
VARVGLALVVTTCALCIRPNDVAAQGARAPAPAPAPPPPARAVGASGLAQVAAEIAQGLGAAPRGAIVVVTPLTSDLPTPRGDDLSVRFGALLAGRLPAARAHEKPAALAVARALSGRAASLVHVQLEVVRGELRATADLYPVEANGWERLRNPAPGPRAHAYATALLDAEIRSFLAPVLLEQAKLHKAKHDEGDVIALGCGDLDADGGHEVVLVSRAKVTIAKVRGGKVVPVRSAPWASIAPRVPVPMREAIGTVLVSPRRGAGELWIGSTDRGGVAVDGTLTLRRALTGLPVPGAGGDACAFPLPEASSLDGATVACTAPPKGDPQPAFALPAPRADAVAAFDLVGVDGSVVPITGAREPGGKLKLRRATASGGGIAEATLENVGAQIAIADLDLDGVPEIVASTDAGDDLLVVASWKGTGLEPRLRFPAKDGVRALAVCPPEERGVPALLAVVGSELWIVR